MSEQPAEPEYVDAELVHERKAAELAVWKSSQEIKLEAFRADQQALDADPSGPRTMRQRLAWAARLAQSGLVPAGFRAGAKKDAILGEAQLQQAAASIVLAQEWGRHLGLDEFAALQHLQVVEGNIGLKPASARGRMLAMGCELDDETVYNAAGFPVAHRITFRRPEWKAAKVVEFRLERALRAGLVDSLERDDAGEIVGVKARSSYGKPLPWESYTEDMLRHRATARVISMYASDLCGGMNLAGADDDLGGDERPERAPVRASAERTDAPAPEHAQRVVPEYDPAEDVSLLYRKLDNERWWEHAGAQVRRRTGVQLAADRIAAWVAAHPDEAAARGLTESVEEPAAVLEDVITVAGEGMDRAREAVRRMNEQLDAERSTVLLNPEPGVEHPAADSEPVDAEEWWPEAAPVDAVAEPSDAEKEAEYVRLTNEELARVAAREVASVPELLARIDALAGGRERRLSFMSRWVAAHRKDPADATAEELAAFLEGVTDA